MPVVHETGFDAHAKVSFILQSKEGRLYTVSTRYALVGMAMNAVKTQAVADQLFSGFAGQFQDVLPELEKFWGCQVWWYDGATQFDALSSADPVEGSVTGTDSLPEEDCVVIRKRTGLSGRTHRGRIFMPLVPLSFAVDGRLTDDAITKYESLAQKFKNVWTFSGTLAGLTGTPKHASFHTGSLDTIIETGVVIDVLNRRDRRNPKGLIYRPSPP